MFCTMTKKNIRELDHFEQEWDRSGSQISRSGMRQDYSLNFDLGAGRDRSEKSTPVSSSNSD